MLGVGKGVDIEELADGLEYRAGVLRRFLLCDKALLLHDRDIEQRHEADDKEGQLVGDVRGVLIDYLQNAAVGKGVDELKLSPCACMQIELPKTLPDWFVETI